MRNIDWLYQTNGMFRETVNQGAAQWMGSDSPAFAGAWLMEQHREERDELVGRHDDPSTYLSDAGVAAVKAFVAEHHGGGEKSDYEDLRGQHLDGPCVVLDAPRADSREKIEADVRDWAGFFNSLNGDDRCEEAINAGHVAMILRWLDRQAAITERELCAGCDWPSIAATPDLEQLARTAEQDRRIAELSEELAKRDKGIERLKRRRGELMEQLRRLTAENVELAARVGELEAARSGLRENLAASASARDAALAGLAAERDRYRAALGRVLDHVDGALREGLSATSGAD